MTSITTGQSAPAGTTVVAESMVSAKAAAEDRTTLGKDAFLQLLVTQMRYQDPSSPMDSSQFMAQTAQLTTVEKLTEMTTTSREAFGLQMRLSASSLLGRQVSWTEGEGTAAVTRTGLVEGASFAGSVPVVRVGGKDVALDAVSEVRPG
ncbi:flagellar hook capping FlgD N-terminal domain-containing protein [Quadrisphaera sp. DSM 44207]|uniref:flagellar hook capping FlgD N-terminal domain-containing protein n=1 Tax=Quadrisphaera sp. DSM 44207 TaxID=1881057 RepID=UPI000885C8B1|nr:flagellar hook capping FlgD N-terminal domain-containing protein [Quadrisphaera sp. DSM 44207]SDQ19983.1 flagellar basal-body rod modification protein FlgD [Quadrisphaera sp. DSM 44207]